MVQDLATHWIQSYPCKTKTSQETERSLQKFLEPSGKPKVLYTDNSLEFGKACKDLSWSHCSSTPHRSQMGLLREQCAEKKKKERLFLVVKKIRRKNGGQIPWNVIPICETFRISCLLGRHHMKDALENPVKDQSSRLVHWLSITLSLRKTSQESISFERKSYLDCSLDTICTWG